MIKMSVFNKINDVLIVNTFTAREIRAPPHSAW